MKSRAAVCLMNSSGNAMKQGPDAELLASLVFLSMAASCSFSFESQEELLAVRIPWVCLLV